MKSKLNAQFKLMGFLKFKNINSWSDCSQLELLQLFSMLTRMNPSQCLQDVFIVHHEMWLCYYWINIAVKYTGETPKILSCKVNLFPYFNLNGETHIMLIYYIQSKLFQAFICNNFD